MVGTWLTMADATTVARPSSWDFPLLWATLPLVGALLLAAAIIAWAKKWRQRAGPEGLTTNAQLAHFRSLYERGELSDEEFTRIRALLGERLKQEVALTPAKEPQAAVPATRGGHSEGPQPSERPAEKTDDLPTPPSNQSP